MLFYRSPIDLPPPCSWTHTLIGFWHRRWLGSWRFWAWIGRPRAGTWGLSNLILAIRHTTDHEHNECDDRHAMTNLHFVPAVCSRQPARRLRRPSRIRPGLDRRGRIGGIPARTDRTKRAAEHDVHTPRHSGRTHPRTIDSRVRTTHLHDWPIAPSVNRSQHIRDTGGCIGP